MALSSSWNPAGSCSVNRRPSSASATACAIAGIDGIKKISGVEVDKISDRPTKDVKVSSVKIVPVK